MPERFRKALAEHEALKYEKKMRHDDLLETMRSTRRIHENMKSERAKESKR